MKDKIWFWRKENKQKQSMRSRLTMIMVMFIIMQSLIFWCVLLGTDFFGRVDEQNVDTFALRATQKMEGVNKNTASIVENVVLASEEITSIYGTNLTFFLDQHDVEVLGGSEYTQQKGDVADILVYLLDKTKVDGAFYILNNGENYSYSTVAIRNPNSTKLVSEQYTYELAVGPSTVAIEHDLTIADDWKLALSYKDVDHDFFNKPMEATKEYRLGGIEQYGYWHIPSEASQDDMITYTVPLFNSVGSVYGIVGVELSKDYFIAEYLEENSMGYPDSFHTLARICPESTLEFDPFIPSTQLTTTYLENGLVLEPATKKITGGDLYEVEGKEGTPLLCVANPWKLYSNQSPFAGEELSYMTFVPSEYPYSNSREIITWFVNICIIAGVISVAVVVIVSKQQMQSIAMLSKKMEHATPYQMASLDKTNLREIDDLIDAIHVLNDKVLESSKRFETILMMTGIDVGGYEILPNHGGVVVTPYIYDVLGLPYDNKIPQRKWDVYFQMLTQRPSPDIEDTYQFVFGEKEIWLRVIHMDTRNGGMGIVQDVTKDVNATIEYKNRAEYDQLTGLYTRSAFYRLVGERILEDDTTTGAVLFIDLDNLKYTNDTHGHESGDVLIKTAARIFDVFTGEGGIVSRLAGDEFAVFLNMQGSEEELLSKIEELYAGYADTTITLPTGETQRVRYSTGISFYPRDGVDIVELLKLADFAMYQAKQTEKGSTRVFDVKLYDDNIFIAKNKELINHLIEERMVRFMYQPIVDLKTGEIYAYEMLMRSMLEEFKSPLHILKVAAADSKLGKLECMLIPKAIGDSYQVREQLGERVIFLNSITSQSITDEIYHDLVDTYGAFLEKFVVEITEGDDVAKELLNRKLDSVREAGMKVAIDDFGSGYSNELRIIEIGPDIIKIDMELLQGIAGDPDKLALVTNIVTYSHERGIRIVGEGIENKEDLEKIMEIGIDYVQGYYVAKPSYEVVDIAEEKKEEIRTFW